MRFTVKIVIKLKEGLGLKRFKSGALGFVIGSITMFSLASAPVFAGSTALQVITNSLNIRLNGEVVGHMNSNYRLENGDWVPYTIVYRGTTYVPIRKMSELLGVGVGYDHDTRTVIIGEEDSVTATGWNLKSKKFIKSEYDFLDTNREVPSRTIQGTDLYDKFIGQGEEGSYTIEHSRRVGSNARPSHYSKTLIEFSGAPDHIQEGERISMSLKNQLLEGSWAQPVAQISFSSVEGIGRGAAGDISFTDGQGNSSFRNQSGIMTSSRVIPKGRPGDIRYLKVNLGKGYGYTYTYEWRD